MASPFKIPKKKQPGDSDSDHLDMQSPLSRLQSSTPKFQSYGVQSGRRNTGYSLSPATSRTPAKPSFSDVVHRLFGVRSPNSGASTANHKAAGGCSRQSPSAQRAESSSSGPSNGSWRPKRASDRLLQPDETEKPVSPPQKKKSLSPLSQRVSVRSPDSLAELRGGQHARNSSTPGGRTWRRGGESSRDAAEKGDAENSPGALKQPRKNSSLSGSAQTSEYDFVSPSRTWKKPSADKSLLEDVRRRVASSGPNKRPSLDRCDDPRERERQRWKEFRENRPRRSAVLQPRPKKPKHTPTEPIVLSSEDEEEGEDEGDGGERTPQSSSRLEESRPGNSEPIQARPASSSRGQTDGSESPPPSFLQLQFASLHAGLAHVEANGEMIVTETDISIPLKGSRIGFDTRLEGSVTVVASQLRGYGVWDGAMAQEGTLLAGLRGPTPSLLFLWVSDAQANLLQRELNAIQTAAATGPPCSFLLLVLKEQLQELQAALLASILDMEEYRKGYSSCSGPPSPLEWTDGLLLFHSCPSPLDHHLLGLLGCSSAKQVQVRKRMTNHSSSGLQQLPTRLIQYPPPPCRGRITVTKEDLACLDAGEFLNDVIIDFYLKFLLLEGVGGPVAERSHVFSSFFYKQLSRRRAAGESDASSVPDRHTRHQRVKTWTRHVDIFTKDFLFVPVNQEAHWFLVVVCFPGLEEVQYEEFQSPTGGSERAAGKPSNSLRPPQPPECTHQGWTRDTVLKRPCILVLDSLKLSYHENVCRLLRDYLQVEWEVRRGGTPRLFTPDSMRSSNCRVAQQDNSSDCGVFLLQYAESFLQNPVVHFDLPLRLELWFPQQRVRQKRQEIRSLIMTLHERQSGNT